MTIETSITIIIISCLAIGWVIGAICGAFMNR